MKKFQLPFVLVLLLLPALAWAQPAHYIEGLAPETKSMVAGEKPYTFKEKPFGFFSGKYVQYLLSNAVNDSLSKANGAQLRAANVKMGPKVLKGADLPQFGTIPNPANLSAHVVWLAVTVKGKDPNKAVGYPWVANTAEERLATLIVSGPCANLDLIAFKDSFIRVCCPMAGGPLVWRTVPLEKQSGIAHEIGDGIVTGRAGFFTEKGVRMFFVEYLAWPEDPVEIGD